MLTAYVREAQSLMTCSTDKQRGTVKWMRDAMVRQLEMVHLPAIFLPPPSASASSAYTISEASRYLFWAAQ
jgi:hypothetical protein